MTDPKSKVMASVDMLLDYKRGSLKDEAISDLVIYGLTPDIANEFLQQDETENIIKFPKNT